MSDDDTHAGLSRVFYADLVKNVKAGDYLDEQIRDLVYASDDLVSGLATVARKGYAVTPTSALLQDEIDALWREGFDPNSMTPGEALFNLVEMGHVVL